MTQQEFVTLSRLLTEIKEVATDFGKAPADDISRLCDVNYLASRALDLLPAKRSRRLSASALGVGGRR